MPQEKLASGFPTSTTAVLAYFLARISDRWVNIPTHLIEPAVRRVSHKTGAYTILDTESGTMFTNLGSTGTIALTLPPATVGLHFPFVVRATQTLRITPNGTETLESTALPRVAGGAGKYISAGVIGARIHLVCLEAGKWAVWASEGTWTVQA